MSRATVAVEHRGAFAAIGLVRQILDTNREALERLVRSAEHMESAGIVIDPTLLRDYINSDNAQAQVRIARLVLRFLRELGAEIAKLPKEPAAAEGGS